MESDPTQEWDKSGNSATSPHFDEEWTVLSARPVVPLSRLKSNGRRRTVLKLSAAFVLSILLGALTALVTATLNEPTSQQANIEVETEQVTIAEAVPTPIEVGTTSEVTEEEPAPVLAEKIPSIVTVKPKTSALQHKQPVPGANVDSLADNPTASVEDRDLQPVNIDRFEERRLRRVLRRQRRERAAQRSRDLTRIDEIFEGRRP